MYDIKENPPKSNRPGLPGEGDWIAPVRLRPVDVFLGSGETLEQGVIEQIVRLTNKRTLRVGEKMLIGTVGEEGDVKRRLEVRVNERGEKLVTYKNHDGVFRVDANISEGSNIWGFTWDNGGDSVRESREEQLRGEVLQLANRDDVEVWVEAADGTRVKTWQILEWRRPVLVYDRRPELAKAKGKPNLRASLEDVSMQTRDRTSFEDSFSTWSFGLWSY
jgi:hypothetical protein